MRRSTRKFSAAQKNAFEQTEAHLDVLAGQYDRVVRAAGVRAATKFSEQALTAAAGDPPWVVPPLDDLVDVTRVTQELLTSTEATRTAAAQSATRPILSAMGVSFSLEAPMVKDLVGRTGKRAAALAVPGLQDAVREAITTGFAEGLSVPQTAALIAEKSNGLSSYQSEMLARTDLIGTANGGSTLAAKAVWPEGNLRKRWLATTDQHTRETHVMADGQVVALDDRFLVGDDMLLFPGDPMGSDEEVCNCRCTIVYIEERSNMSAAGEDTFMRDLTESMSKPLPAAWESPPGVRFEGLLVPSVMSSIPSTTPWEQPEVDELIAASWDSTADDGRAVPDGGYGDGVTVAADPNDWSITAAGWEGETLPVEIEVETPVEEPVIEEAAVVAAVSDDSTAMALGALLAGFGQKWSEMVAALTSLGSRPVVVEMPQELTAALSDRPDIVIHVPEQPPAQITVEQPAITVEAPNVTVEPAQITVETPAVTVEVAAAEVNVPPAEVTVVVEKEPQPDRRVTFHRNPGTGRIESAEVEDEAG